MTKVILWIALALEVGFLYALHAWLKAMDERFVYGFACGVMLFCTMGAIIQVTERIGR